MKPSDNYAGWRDRETAPKDGRWILALWDEFTPRVVRWEYGAWQSNGGGVIGSDPDFWLPIPPNPISLRDGLLFTDAPCT